MIRSILLSLMMASGASHAMCFAEAAGRYSLPEDLLRAIAKVESSNNPEATNLSHYERTKTYDIGLMQINSSWLPRLARMGITEKMLREPCQNVLVGAWILSQHLRESGADWNGVGAYNASCRTLSKPACEEARNGYAWKVYRALMRQRNLVPEGAAPTASVRVASVTAHAQARFIQTVELSQPVPAGDENNQAPAQVPTPHLAAVMAGADSDQDLSDADDDQTDDDSTHE